MSLLFLLSASLQNVTGAPCESNTTRHHWKGILSKESRQAQRDEGASRRLLRRDGNWRKNVYSTNQAELVE